MTRLICFTLILIFCSINVFSQSDETYDLIEIKEDFDMAKNAFYNLHPRPFQWHPKDSFDILWDNAEEKLKSDMTADALQGLLYPIFQKLGCGHSRVYTAKKITKQRAKSYKKGAVRKQLPFSIKTIDGKTYINKYLLEDSLIFKGDQLLSLGGASIESIKKELSQFITSDGLNKTHYYKAIDKNFIGYYNRANGDSDAYDVIVLDSLGEKKEISLNPFLTSKEISKQKKKDKKKKKVDPTKKSKPAKFTTLLKKDNYRFLRSKEDTSVAVIRIPAFAGSAGKKLYKKAYKIIEADKSIKNLVIDLRGNGGGSASESWFLTSTLIKEKFQTDIARRKDIDRALVKNMSTSSFGLFSSRIKLSMIGKKAKEEDYYKTEISFKPQKKHRYDGKLFVLIDGYSFSASSVVSSYLRSTNRAVFIGQETGGGMYGTNAMHSPSVYLPNTTIRIRIGLWALDQIVEGGVPGRGIFPDYETRTTFEDYLEDRDVDMEKVYELVKAGE